jgi:hypothetical protein
MKTAGNTVSEIVPDRPAATACAPDLLRVTFDDDDGVVGVDDNQVMGTAPLGVVSGAVVGVVTGCSSG